MEDDVEETDIYTVEQVFIEKYSHGYALEIVTTSGRWTEHVDRDGRNGYRSFYIYDGGRIIMARDSLRDGFLD